MTDISARRNRLAASILEGKEDHLLVKRDWDDYTSKCPGERAFHITISVDCVLDEDAIWPDVGDGPTFPTAKDVADVIRGYRPSLFETLKEWNLDTGAIVRVISVGNANDRAEVVPRPCLVMEQESREEDAL